MVAMQFPISPLPKALFELSLVSFVLLFLPSFAGKKTSAGPSWPLPTLAICGAFLVVFPEISLTGNLGGVLARGRGCSFKRVEARVTIDMRAMILESPRQRLVGRDVLRPAPRPDQLLVRVRGLRGLPH